MAAPNKIGSFLATVNDCIPRHIANPTYNLIDAFGWATNVQGDSPSWKTNALGAVIVATATLAISLLGFKSAITRIAPRFIKSELLKVTQWVHMGALLWVVNRALTSIYTLKSETK